MNYKKVIRIFNNNKLYWITAFLFFILFSSYAIFKHMIYQTYGWDLGIYSQQVWLDSRFMLRAHDTIRGLFLLSDHFGPILVLISPLYWISSRAEILLIIQALMVVLAAYPLWVISEYYIKNIFFSLTIVLLFYTSLGIQNAIDFDFHLATIAVFFISFFIYYLWKRKYLFSTIFFALAFITKEDVSFYIFCITIFFFIFNPTCNNSKNIDYTKHRLYSFIVAIFSIIYSIVVIKIIMPSISSDTTINQYFQFGIFGNNYFEVIKNIFLHPVILIKQFIFNPVKLNSALMYIKGFGFLPLFAPHVLMVSFPFILTKYVSTREAQWGLNGQYSVTGVLELAYATIFVVGYLNLIIRNRKLKQILFTIISLCLMSYGLYSNLSYKGSLLNNIRDIKEKPGNYNNINNLINKIPNKVSVETQNNIIPHISSRKEIYIIACPICNIPEDFVPQYILLDTRFGLGFSSSNINQMDDLIDSLLNEHKRPWETYSVNYQLVSQEGTAYLFKNFMK
jgi:uncharacterized membrane protein